MAITGYPQPSSGKGLGDESALPGIR